MWLPFCLFIHHRSVEGSTCAQARVVSLQSHTANYWPGVYTTVLLVIFADIFRVNVALDLVLLHHFMDNQRHLLHPLFLLHFSVHCF